MILIGPGLMLRRDGYHPAIVHVASHQNYRVGTLMEDLHQFLVLFVVRKRAVFKP